MKPPVPQSRAMSGHCRHLRRICLDGLVWLVFVPGLLGQSSHELRALLNRLNGSWQGEMIIQSLDGREIGSFRMNRVYAWSGDILEWQSTLDLATGAHSIRGRYFIRLGRLYATVSRPGKPAQDYTGTPQLGGVFWESALRDRRDLREVVDITEDGSFLDLDSFEVLGLEEFPGVVRMRGRLRAVREGEPAGDSTRSIEKGTEWLDPSDPIDSLRVYAPGDAPVAGP